MTVWDVARITIGGLVTFAVVSVFYRVAAAQTDTGPFDVASVAELVASALNPKLGIIIAALVAFFTLTRGEFE